MRVLLVTPVAPPYGGMALQAQQLETLLRGDGVEVGLFASNFALPGPLRTVERIPAVRTLLRSTLIWFRLWKAIGASDVVHILAASWLYFFVVVYPAVLLGRARGKRVVLNYRSGAAGDFFRQYGWLATPAFRLASAVTAPSEFLGQVIRRAFHVPVSIVPNVVNRTRFPYRQRTTIRPRMLVTRHLEKIYDVGSVLKAFRSVHQRHPDASLWIAGSGSEEAHLRSMVSSWGLPSVRFLGEIAHADLAEVYGECDIYVNASLVDNFPGGLIEASAAGLVVVTTAPGGIPFIYENGRSAYLVNTGDWQALAAAIERVLAVPSDALEMTKVADVLVRACEWPEVRKCLFQAYGLIAGAIPAREASLDSRRCAGV